MKKNNLYKLLGIAFVVAIVSTGIFYGLFVSKMSSSTGSGKMLVVAAKTLKAGVVLQSSDVKLIPWPAQQLPKGAFERVDQVAGNTVFDPINEDEPVFAAHLATDKTAGGSGVPTGMRAVTVHVTDSTGIMALLRGGQRVDVQVVVGRGENKETVVRTALENIQVLAVGTQSEQSSQGATLPVVTLLANPAAADILAAADSGARVRLILRNPLDQELSERSSLSLGAVMRSAGAGAAAPGNKRSNYGLKRPMLILSILAFFVAIFLLCSIAVTVAWMGFLKTTAEESDAARRDLEAVATAPSPEEDVASPLFRAERLSTLNFWDSVLARFDFVEILRERIAQADLDWSVGRVTLGMLLAGTLMLLVLLKFLAIWAALMGAALIAFAPYWYILRKRDQRFLKFRENFPDVLDSLSRALRAGYPLSASMDMISSETMPPVSVEMRKTAAEANLGMGWPRALENLGRRMPLLEVNLFTAAVQLHARTGGKLSEVLSSLAENMREAISLQGEVRALAAHGKLTGVILTILPLAIAGMMMWVSPGYMQVLYNYPQGKNLITAAVVCLVLAHLVIRKIVDIKV